MTRRLIQGKNGITRKEERTEVTKQEEKVVEAGAEERGVYDGWQKKNTDGCLCICARA